MEFFWENAVAFFYYYDIDNYLSSMIQILKWYFNLTEKKFDDCAEIAYFNSQTKGYNSWFNLGVEKCFQTGADKN